VQNNGIKGDIAGFDDQMLKYEIPFNNMAQI
jgi:hypothetical protein